MRCKPPLKIIDMIGKTFGRLTVIKRVPNKGKNARWGCICSCGEYVEVDGCHLRNGGVKSCGCILKESKWNKTHGLSNSRIYELYSYFALLILFLKMFFLFEKNIEFYEKRDLARNEKKM